MKRIKKIQSLFTRDDKRTRGKGGRLRHFRAAHAGKSLRKLISKSIFISMKFFSWEIPALRIPPIVPRPTTFYLHLLNYSYSFRARLVFSYSINTKRCGGDKDPPKNSCCASHKKFPKSFFYTASSKYKTFSRRLSSYIFFFFLFFVFAVLISKNFFAAPIFSFSHFCFNSVTASV